MSGESSELRVLRPSEVGSSENYGGERVSPKTWEENLREGGQRVQSCPPPAVRLRRSWNPWWYRQSKGDGKGQRGSLNKGCGHRPISPRSRFLQPVSGKCCKASVVCVVKLEINITTQPFFYFLLNHKKAAG